MGRILSLRRWYVYNLFHSCISSYVFQALASIAQSTLCLRLVIGSIQPLSGHHDNSKTEIRLDRALNALKELGLPPDAEELVEFVSKNWDQIEKKGADGTKEQKQQEIVSRLLERALAAHLEGNVDEVKKAVT